MTVERVKEKMSKKGLVGYAATILPLLLPNLPPLLRNLLPLRTPLLSPPQMLGDLFSVPTQKT
jgi:hypothetical protein